MLRQPNEVILSVTNRTENDVTVWLEPLVEEITKSEHMHTSALVSFVSQPESGTVVDKYDSSRTSIPAALTPADRDSEHVGFVCFRRGNKIAINCRVTPLSSAFHRPSNSDADTAHPRVTIAFVLRHSLVSTAKSSANPLDTSLSSSLVSSPNDVTSPSSPSPSVSIAPSVVSQIVNIDFGPMRAEHGLVVVNKPKYIEECP